MVTLIEKLNLSYECRNELSNSKLKKIVALICLCVQIAVVIMYGFTGVHISQYVCLGIWLVCGMLGVSLLKERQAI